MNTQQEFPTGIYEVTQGEYTGAAIFLVEVSDPEESEFVYLTIYNPESKESHEITFDGWKLMQTEDGLKWADEIPEKIKDQYMTGGFGLIAGLE